MAIRNDERVLYRTKQRIQTLDYMTLLEVLLPVLAINAAFAVPRWLLLLMAGVGTVWNGLGLALAPLTVLVTESRLVAFSRLRMFGWHAPLSEISNVEVRRVTLKDFYLNNLPRLGAGLVYSPKGARAVFVRLFNGEEILLGCDEPEALVKVLREQIGAAHM